MNAKPRHHSQLHDAREQLIARFASWACNDTYYGEAGALVRAKELHDDELENVVSDIYSRSTGKHSTEYEAWECSECGSVYLGRKAAAGCCNDSD